VATVSFVAARAAPTGGFWVALAGGVALARAAQRRGARLGFGASVAAMLETVAIMGPARFGVPLTQAITAPLLGRLEARGTGHVAQIAACGLIRLLHNTATTAFFIWIVTGGLDAYAGTYEGAGRRLGIEIGVAEALGLTALVLLLWAAFASTVQVLVYRRGLRRWPGEPAGPVEGPPAVERAGGPGPPDTPGAGRRFDPRFVVVAAVVAFALLLTSTSWPVLAVSAGWLLLAWAISRPDPDPVPTGLAIAAMLACGALLFGFGGGLGLDTTLRRALRATLLVLVATWLRAAAGAEGLREVSRRTLGRLGRFPAAPEAAAVLDRIAAEGRLLAAGRALAEQVRGVRKRPLPILDAVLDWVTHESARFRPSPPAAPLRLRARTEDALLLALAAAPLVPLGLS
jgi:hypothetical protein